jgi:hypothetical protein
MKQQAGVRALWLDRVRRWMASGMGAKEFAAQEGCRPKALMVWRWQLGLGPRQSKRPLPVVAKQAAPRFVELLSPHLIAAAVKPTSSAVAPSTRPFEITLPNGARVLVPAQFDRQALGVLVDLVGSR